MLKKSTRYGAANLWRRYVVALLIFTCTILAVHFAHQSARRIASENRRMVAMSVDQTALVARVIHYAQDQVDHGGRSTLQLRDTIDQFEAMHNAIIAKGAMNTLITPLYFAPTNPLDPAIRRFIDLARQLSERPAHSQALILDRMLTLADGPLADGLGHAQTQIAAKAAANIAAAEQRVTHVIAFALFAMLMMAAFIFWPAHMTIRDALDHIGQQRLKLANVQTKLRVANDRLHTMAHSDALTELPNRSSLNDYLNNLGADGRMQDVSVVYVGLDHFKSINDSVGHAVGDAILIMVANLLQQCVDEDEFVARTGGDEFVLVTTEPPHALTKRVLHTLSVPMHVQGRTYQITASIGYDTAHNDDDDPLLPLANADIALNAAKVLGRNRIEPFTPNMRIDAETLQQLQSELPLAIRNGEIEPWFQPQISLHDGMLSGVEVLARWRHPVRGLLTPDIFIPVAEKAGFIIEMDHAIWKAAMVYAREWQTTDKWKPSISLNAAPETIADPQLIERFLLSIQQSDLDPSQLVVEVLETTLINGADDMAAINIDTLAECGVSLELDDFGTGYASLSKLTQLPLAGIKLDRSLIAPLPDSGADSVVRAILALAKELGLKVIAEGVETSEQASHLNMRGALLAQGYGFARPMPADAFSEWLTANANVPVFATQQTAPTAMQA